MNNAIQSVKAYTFVGDFGQTVYEFELKCSGAIPPVNAADFVIEGGRKDISGKVPPSGILAVRQEAGALILEADPFVYRSDFRIVGTGAAQSLSFEKSDITDVAIRTADEFTAHDEDGVLYRLFSPDGTGPRALILFLHGGGECGTDNIDQMVGTMGAANLAERFPDLYIMAPQAPGAQMSGAGFQAMMKLGNPFDMRIGKLPDSGKGKRGWNRDYLAKVCRVIRGMIADGRVDARRVYVTGMSMGGGGTIRALSVDPDLFAAAAPICPSMNGETFAILNNIRNTALWLSTAYIDHQPARHVYLTRAYQKLLADGNVEVHLTIYTADELAEYGIGNRKDLTYDQLLAENHNSWTLTYHNEDGILDWLISVVK